MSLYRERTFTDHIPIDDITKRQKKLSSALHIVQIRASAKNCSLGRSTNFVYRLFYMCFILSSRLCIICPVKTFKHSFLFIFIPYRKVFVRSENPTWGFLDSTTFFRVRQHTSSNALSRKRESGFDISKMHAERTFTCHRPVSDTMKTNIFVEGTS